MSAKEKKSFVLRINAEVMEAVEKWAADEFRSTNGQLEWIITETLRKAKRCRQPSGESIPKKEDKLDK